MEKSESPIKHLKCIVKDVTECLQSKAEGIKTSLIQYKEAFSLTQRELMNENSHLNAKLREVQGLESTLLNKKDLLVQSIENEEKDLLKAEKENRELIEMTKTLEASNKNLLERQIDAEEKLKTLSAKCKMMREKAEVKSKEQKNINDMFKIFFGMDIIKIKENIIKILFTNLETECFVIIDFSRFDCVSETFPELNLEKLNYAFNESPSFYEFVKLVRTQLKSKL